jgi:hypothetical protein
MPIIRFLVIPAAVLLAASGPDMAEPPRAANVSFEKDIQPILEQRCIACHNPVIRKGGLSLVDGRGLRDGSNSGAVVVPSKAAASRLIQVVSGQDAKLKMPAEGAALSADEISKLKAWIDGGAAWPKDVFLKVPSIKPLHWAFAPIASPQLPAVKNEAWVRNGIDRFILARLEKEEIAPSPEAEPVTLIRRVFFDLTGLPPTPAEVDKFLSEARAKPEEAYEKLVDRLLASPHYGERWGRHWLDTARYADSDGYEKDTGRPWAWRYRDWVINALNLDLPFDEFAIEQLAGDLLTNSTIEQKIATGFHRNTLTNKEGGVDQEEFRVAACVDRVNTTAKAWLGITMGCCQCHDHKYDPFTQREFYQFFAFFNSDKEIDIDAPLSGEEDTLKKKRSAHAAKHGELQKAVDDYKQKNPTADKNDKQLAKLTKVLADHDKAAPVVSKAPTLQLGQVRSTHLMIRGDFLRPGIEVSANVPAILPQLKSNGQPTRLDLARWIVAPENPLTRRMLVNWLWQKYFGRGLVATLEDFGTQGEKPSHPELLDYLASRVVEQRWSLKSLHKLIVMSATYRQSSKARPELKDRDPLNILLARQNRSRLEAEIVRDNALACSGLLTRTVGGPSVRPPQPPGISELTYADSAKWVASVGPDRYRRGMYTWFQRTSPYPMLMGFDAPDGVVCTVKRPTSNTPLQALTLMNDVVFIECARALGRRLAEMKGTNTERIDAAFRTCLARQPTTEERNRLEQLFNDFHEMARKDPATSKLIGNEKLTGDAAEIGAWTAFARTLLNLDEFITRD